MTDDKLKEEVQQRAQTFDSFFCRVDFRNSTPPEWKVTITTILAGFTFSDGTNYTDKNSESIIYSGESGTCTSRNENKCVKKIYCFMVYEQGGKAYTTDTEYEDAGSGECWIHVGVELAPQAKISENVADSTEKSLRLVLRPAGTIIGNA